MISIVNLSMPVQYKASLSMTKGQLIKSEISQANYFLLFTQNRWPHSMGVWTNSC